MSSRLKTILREVASIQAALLRIRSDKGPENIQVKVAFDSDNNLHCIVPGKIPRGMKFTNKKAHLVQRHHDDYFFISGYILEEVHENQRVLSIGVFKASWFVRKSRGYVSWFREKHAYENEQKKMSPVS